MKDLANELRAAVAEARERLEALDDEASLAKGPGTWSRRQILGHLIDSALNNDQRFVRAQSGEPLDFPDYAQDAWVAAHGYAERPWSDLVTLWVSLNEHLARTLELLPPERLATPCSVGGSPAQSLEFIARDYPKHLQHHLAQIFDTDAAAGKKYPPFSAASEGE